MFAKYMLFLRFVHERLGRAGMLRKQAEADKSPTLHLNRKKGKKKNASVWLCLTQAQGFMYAVIVSCFPCLMNEAVAAMAVIEEIYNFIRREMTCP